MSGARTITLKRAWDRLRSRVDADVRGCRFIRHADPRLQEWVQDLVLEAFMEGARASHEAVMAELVALREAERLEVEDLVARGRIVPMPGARVVERVSRPFADAAREARFRTWPTASYGPAPYAEGAVGDGDGGEVGE